VLQDFFASTVLQRAGAVLWTALHLLQHRSGGAEQPEQYLVTPPRSPEKNEFGICRGAVSHCLEGLTSTLQSLSQYSIMFSIPRLTTSPYFYANNNTGNNNNIRTMFMVLS